MKILVCMKQVPQKDAPLKLNEAGTWIREDVSYEVNEPDAYALEEALRQKEKHGGEVVVVDRRSCTRSSRCCAKRWPRAPTAPFISTTILRRRWMPSSTARAIAAAIEGESFEMIFTGLQSDDYGFAQTGVLLAETPRLAARDHHHRHRKDRYGTPAEARTGGRPVSMDRHATALCTDHPERNQ